MKKGVFTIIILSTLLLCPLILSLNTRITVTTEPNKNISLSLLYNSGENKGRLINDIYKFNLISDSKGTATIDFEISGVDYFQIAIRVLGVMDSFEYYPNIPIGKYIQLDLTKHVVNIEDCQYKEVAYSNKSVSNLYVNGIKQENVLESRNANCKYNSVLGKGPCYFEVFNNIDYTVNVRVEFVQGGGTSFENIIIPAHEYVSISRIVYYTSDNILFDTIEYKFQSNNFTEAKWEKEEYLICKQCFGVDCLNDGSSCTGDYQCGSSLCSHGICSHKDIYEKDILDIKNNMTSINNRLSILETWKNMISNTITSLWSAIAGNSTKSDNLNDEIISLKQRLSLVENKTSQVLPDYFKYLSSTDRKNMVCGHGEDNHLTHIEDLGWSCDIAYKVYKTVEKATCKCKKVQ